MAKSHYGGEVITVKDAIQNQSQRQHNFGVKLKQENRRNNKGDKNH